MESHCSDFLHLGMSQLIALAQFCNNPLHNVPFSRGNKERKLAPPSLLHMGHVSMEHCHCKGESINSKHFCDPVWKYCFSLSSKYDNIILIPIRVKWSLILETFLPLYSVICSWLLSQSDKIVQLFSLVYICVTKFKILNITGVTSLLISFAIYAGSYCNVMLVLSVVLKRHAAIFSYFQTCVYFSIKFSFLRMLTSE